VVSGVPGLEDSENASVRNLHCMATKGNSSQTALSRENKLRVGDVWGGGWQKGRWSWFQEVGERPSCWLS